MLSLFTAIKLIYLVLTISGTLISSSAMFSLHNNGDMYNKAIENNHKYVELYIDNKPHTLSNVVNILARITEAVSPNLHKSNIDQYTNILYHTIFKQPYINYCYFIAISVLIILIFKSFSENHNNGNICIYIDKNPNDEDK